MASKRDVEALLDRNLTVREIAERIGAGVEYVSATLRRNGWEHRVRRVNKPPAGLREINAELLGALGALGAIGNGYCFCSHDRDPEKASHQPECRDARAAIAKAEGKPCSAD